VATVAERNDRLAATARRMAAEGVDLLLAASNGFHFLDRADAVVHLTGFRSLGESLLVLRADGAAKLLVTPAYDAERAAAYLALCGGRFDCLATDDLAGALARELAGGGAAAGPLAAAGFETLPHPLAARLMACAGKELQGFDEALFSVDPRKSAVEIERARRATAIAERGFERLVELARPGIAECDLAVAVNGYMKSLGADDNFLMLCALPHNLAVMPSSTRKIQAGDTLLAELTPSFEGQFAQICRTVSIGQPPAILKEKYDLVVRAMWAGIETVRPGIPMSRVCDAIDAVLKDAGYGEYCKPPHMRRRGHGLGSGSAAPGDVATNNSTRLEEDMVFIVHPNQYIPETGYLMCGEPVRVTAAGVQTLSRRTAALGVIPCE